MAGAMWMVRAGEAGYLVADFARESAVAINWPEMGDLAALATREGLRAKYDETYPEAHPSAAANAAMLWKFRAVIAVGDWVLTADPVSRAYLVGKVTSEYRYQPGRVADSPHARETRWEAGRVGRDSLSVSTRNTLGSTPTVFALNDDAATEVLRVLRSGPPAPVAPAEVREELGQIKEETVAKARELIKDKIAALSPDAAEQLVAAVLRAMGYKARVTPKGPDRGVDVIASPDGLGLEEPRIKAEVKHRGGSAMGSQDIRSFLGGSRAGDRGLYVSTGGFSKDARYEADRANVPLTLLTLDDLADLVVTHYENFDLDGRVLLPLTRLYWPAE